MTERLGRLQHVRVNADTIAIQGIPSVLYAGHGGLLDIAVDPEFEQSHLVYLSYLQGEETPRPSACCGRGSMRTTAPSPTKRSFSRAVQARGPSRSVAASP